MPTYIARISHGKDSLKMVVAMELKRDRDRAALLKTEQLIHDTMELIGNMRSETIGGQIDGPTV